MAAQVWVAVAPGAAVRFGTGFHRRHVEGAGSPPALAISFAGAISIVGERTPFRASCLVQALALVMLLATVRIPARLIVGVSNPDRKDLRAHAWVECGGKIVLGGALAAEFSPLSCTAP
jgi:hypothetical protein